MNKSDKTALSEEVTELLELRNGLNRRIRSIRKLIGGGKSPEKEYYAPAKPSLKIKQAPKPTAEELRKRAPWRGKAAPKKAGGLSLGG